MAADSTLAKREPASSLATQFRVISALILRETKTRYWKNRLGYIWALLEPFVHVAVWFVVFIFLRSNPTADVAAQMLFFMTGMIPFLAFRNTAHFMETAISANRALLNYPLVKHFDLIAARWCLEAAGMTIVAIVVFTVLVSTGYAKPPQNITGLALALALQFALAFGMGCCSAVFSVLSDGYAKIEDLVMRLLYFVSGTFFHIETLPEVYKSWLALNPAAHGVQLFRDAYFPQYQASFASVTYVLVWAFGLSLVGLIGARLARERLNLA